MGVSQRIDADTLIHGTKAPIADGSLVIEGDQIVYAGPQATAPPGDETTRVPVLMPGLWDSHCHFFGIRWASLRELVTVPVVQRGLRAAEDARQALQAGFTSLREVGGLGVDLAAAVEEGILVGPHIYGSGAILSMTGGHGDIHSLPLDFVASSESLPDLELCDGVPECLRGVRRQLRKGARVLKVCASGGVVSELDKPEHPQFSPEELAAIVEEAARADRVVAAHCHGKAGIMAAVRAGVRTIEHGTFLDPESARAMADSGTILVSTRFIGEALLSEDSSVELPDFARRKLEVTYRRGAEAMQHALAAGVKIAAGTDIMTSGDMWGRNARELTLLVELGMTERAAIQAGTAHGPLTVGAQAESEGVLERGARADAIAVSANPLEKITVLEDPSSITHVWKSGVLVKAPGRTDPEALDLEASVALDDRSL